MANTRIRDVRVFHATSALSRPIADATHEIESIEFYVVEVETDGGVIGQGYLLAFHYSQHAIRGALLDIARFVREREYSVDETGRLRAEYEHESEYFGMTGLQRWALATLDIAFWDAWARHLDQPIWRLLGSHDRPVPVYGSGGWLSYSDKELVDEVVDYASRGFTAVKIKVGSADLERDVERLRLVRDAVGPRVRIMMDANQGMDVPRANALISRVSSLGINWFEEPIDHRDFDGYASLRAGTSMALAMGEREFDTVALRELVRLRAIDLWQPDIVRIGGVQAWRESAALAAAFGVPVLPHYYKDYDVPLLATVPNAAGAESFDWIDGIIDEPMHIEGGFARARRGPGWGFRFLEQHLREVTSPGSEVADA